MSATATDTLEAWEVTDITDSGPYSGAYCQHCGTGIRYVVTVRSLVDHDTTMEIGTSCAEQVGLTEAQLRRLRSEQRHLSRASERAEREAHAAAMWAANTADPEVAELLEWALTTDGVAAAIAAKARRFILSDAQVAALWSCLDEALNPPPVSQHVGTVGETLTAEVTIERTVLLEPYCYGAARPWLVVARTDDGDLVVTKTTAKWVRQLDTDRGARHTWTGTVKAHGEFRGDAQTVLTRVKATGPDRAWTAR